MLRMRTVLVACYLNDVKLFFLLLSHSLLLLKTFDLQKVHIRPNSDSPQGHYPFFGAATQNGVDTTAYPGNFNGWQMVSTLASLFQI